MKRLLGIAVLVGLFWGTSVYAKEDYSLRMAFIWMKDIGVCNGGGLSINFPTENPYLKRLTTDIVVVKKGSVYGGLGLGIAPSSLVNISVGIVANTDTGDTNNYVGITGNVSLLSQLWNTVSQAISAGLAEADALGEAK